MGEFSEYLKGRYLKGKNVETQELMNKQRVKNALSATLDEYLSEAGDVLTFEVLPRELPYVLAVLMEEPLRSKYITTQVSSSLFTAQLQEVDLGI